jgi:drug/metabolite transporter (DMT)-like permease
MTRNETIGAGQAVCATLCFSTGAILVRWASALSPWEVTSLRMLLGSAVVGSAAWLTGRRLRLSGAELRRLLPVGLIAAVHFATFIGSLYFTTVAHSLTLVYTAPLFIAALSRSILGEPLPRRTLPATLLALAGVAVLTGLEPRLTWRMVTGDALAVMAAASFGLYSLLGRRERDTLPLLTYAGWVYFLAGIATAPLAVDVLRRPAPLDALAAVAAMAVIPLAMGHTLYNAALRRLHPTLPNLIATQEVTLAVLLAWVLLGEVPPASAVIGAAVTLSGVCLVLWAAGPRRAGPAA